MLDLPYSVLNLLFTEWLGIESIVLLDSATTNALGRERLVDVLQKTGVTFGPGLARGRDEFILYDEMSNKVYNWLCVRGFSINRLWLAGDWFFFSDDTRRLSETQLSKIESLVVQLDKIKPPHEARCSSLAEMVRHCNRVQRLTFFGRGAMELLPNVMNATPQPVESLWISNVRIEPSFVTLSDRFELLQSLEIHYCGFDDVEVVAEPCKLSNLEVLKLKMGHCKDELGWLVRHSPRLELLRFECDEYGGTKGFTNKGTRGGLRSLSLTIERFAKGSVRHINSLVKHCTRLESFHLDNPSLEITDIVEALPFDSLRHVALSKTSVLDLLMRTRLETIQLNGFAMGDLCLSTIAYRCSRLTVLKLVRGDFTSKEVMNVVTSCPLLVDLTLPTFRLGDEDVSAMAPLVPNLKVLAFNGRSLTRSGVLSLPRCSRLKKISAYGVGASSEDDWLALEEAAQHIEVRTYREESSRELLDLI